MLPSLPSPQPQHPAPSLPRDAPGGNFWGQRCVPHEPALAAAVWGHAAAIQGKLLPPNPSVRTPVVAGLGTG